MKNIIENKAILGLTLSVVLIGGGIHTISASSNATFLYFAPNGNVGIGTTTPTEKLVVPGNINATGQVCDSNGCIGDSMGGASNREVVRQHGSVSVLGARSGTLSSNSVYLGELAGSANYGGGANVFIGAGAGQMTDTGSFNVYLGSFSGRALKGTYNTMLGGYTGFSMSQGDRNTLIGNGAGFSLSGGSGNVFIGFNAGKYLQNAEEKLIIANNEMSNDVLVYGDFNSKQLAIGTNAISSNLSLDINGNVGADAYCDQDGNNCHTISELSAGGSAEVTWVDIEEKPTYLNKITRDQEINLFDNEGVKGATLRLRDNNFEIIANNNYGFILKDDVQFDRDLHIHGGSIDFINSDDNRVGILSPTITGTFLNSANFVVSGNIKSESSVEARNINLLGGNITSSGDICIGNCN